ncbi:Ferredoxin-like protein FixX [Methylacidimicrobium cyclopophantes]|uniref:Ferredoxin-like protein n=1 Tax=Methylacidimicrobium cyclopophantes TaxID=1041766 RepID=A0A5E6M889_9BACT|nr:ferredoxin family protein [Methylacidimicrobium cyclopophantes]VVM04611.1 Ferredoxin-like protein FixX [Methylacidimicrobium cyclopophantes]
MNEVEEKLYQNRYRLDAGRPHIRIRNPEVCRSRCGEKSCAACCPAGCYTLGSEGEVTLLTDGCLECGTCRIICSEFRNVDWEYPRGGFGVLFKFG